MPVDLYIGPKKRGTPWWQGCLLSIIILAVGAYLIVLLLASNGIYVSSRVPLPQSLQPTPTATPKPTETAESHMQKGDAFFMDGQFEPALAEYQAVVALEPLNDSAYAKMVKPLILLRKYDDAVNAGKRAMQINDQRPENMGALAEAYDWQGNFDDAINLALRATELNPNYAQGYAFAAEIYADMNRPDKGLPAALKAVQLDDKSVDTHRDLAYVYEAMGSYRKAIPEYQRAIEIAPKFGYLYISLARNYRALNNFKDAIATLQEALKIDPKNPQVYDELGWTYALSGDYARAVAQLKEATSIDPTYEVPYGHMGYVDFVQQNWQDTVTNLEKALSLGGDKLEYYYELSIGYVNLKDCTKGKQYVDKAVSIDSTDTAVQGAVDWYNQHCQ
jgi:tetratricopeptide (TPR) repeat protein